MELVKKQIHANQVGKKMVDQFLVDDDYNVPDMKNDVHRIITSEGIVKIEDVRKVENYVRVTGKLNFQILYVTERELNRRCRQWKERSHLRRWCIQMKGRTENLLFTTRGLILQRR